MNVYLTILSITALTGVGGLALGGGLAAAVHSPSDRTVSLLLRFTSGIMLSVVCFDLIVDGLENGGTVSVLSWIMIGYFCTYLLNFWIDKRAHHSHDGHEHHLHTAGLALACAVALHNMPVGMAIGATFADSAALPGHTGHAGILAALIIGLHNIPEGMSIATPLLTGGARPLGAVGVAALSGLPTILGALLGYSVGAMNPLLLSVSLSFAAGAMLYVIFGELLPEAEQLWRHRLSGFAVMLGLLLGMALVFGHIH